ncbi:tellurite resistance TerB family protein [Singulisphaera sp. PoT]|uniref:tellurite resistance TerB family protein n=1 Tax=Singulisphaera sp. PoT TaxID=3411797 RepID=UPI003BF553B0
MGFLDKLKSFASGTGLGAEFAKIRDRAAVNATLAAIALVAGADGDIEPAERKAGADFVRKGDLFQSFDREQLATTLEGYYSKATNEIAKQDLFDAIGKVKGTDYARSVVKIGIGIAGADGEFEPQEKEILREVCLTLGLNPVDFKGLA